MTQLMQATQSLIPVAGLKRIGLLSVFLTLQIMAGCVTNPVTGKSELSLVSESWELKIKAQQYLPAQSQGGDYVADPGVQAYVQEVGNKVAAVSDRQPCMSLLSSTTRRPMLGHYPAARSPLIAVC